MTTQPAIDQVLAAVTVEPGDLLVVVLPMYTTQQSIDAFGADLRENIPALKGRLLVIANVEQLAVIRDGAIIPVPEATDD